MMSGSWVIPVRSLSSKPSELKSLRIQLRIREPPSWTGQLLVVMLPPMKRVFVSLFVMVALIANAIMADAHAASPDANLHAVSESQTPIHGSVGSADCLGEDCLDHCRDKNCSEAPCSGGQCPTHHHHRTSCHHASVPFLRTTGFVSAAESALRLYARQVSSTLLPGPDLDGPFQPPRSFT